MIKKIFLILSLFFLTSCNTILMCENKEFRHFDTIEPHDRLKTCEALYQEFLNLDIYRQDVLFKKQRPDAFSRHMHCMLATHISAIKSHVRTVARMKNLDAISKNKGCGGLMNEKHSQEYKHVIETIELGDQKTSHNMKMQSKDISSHEKFSIKRNNMTDKAPDSKPNKSNKALNNGPQYKDVTADQFPV